MPASGPAGRALAPRRPGRHDPGVAVAQTPSLRRAARIGRVLSRHGLRGDAPEADRARGLRLALEELGPTFCKLGQMLSTRPDLSAAPSPASSRGCATTCRRCRPAP